jgi:ATP adenylyltransferase
MPRDIMWAPWRMGYVTGAEGRASGGCIFCDLPAQDDDRGVYILHRGRLAYVIMNRFPYNNGHLMVVPYAHVASITDLEPDAASELMTLARRSQTVVQQAMGPHGFNLGMNQGSAAGAGIEEHLHLHIVPRWVGDTNFMPAIGDTRVMPQHLDDTYALLERGFAA